MQEAVQTILDLRGNLTGHLVLVRLGRRKEPLAYKFNKFNKNLIK